jgi:undecaprenyl-diphosphatase
MQLWQVIFLGILEGLTEFIPVSSTGHLVLAGYFLGVNSPGKSFEVLIQLGAILAIVTVYFTKLLRLLIDLPRDRRTQLFVCGIVLAFLPAAILGATFHKYIKAVFEHPELICVALIVGGAILLYVDRMELKPVYHDIMDVPPVLALKIGACQTLAMIAGVSRSGATIVGAMLLGVDKRAAAEFSFFLAMPTMAGAFGYDLYKNWGVLNAGDITNVVIGFVTAFIAAVFVVRYVLDYVTSHGFAVFGWWRIIVGGMGLGAIAMQTFVK